MKHNTIIAIFVAAISAFGAVAQNSSAEEVPAARLNIGANLGLRANFMRFSELDKKTYPDRNASLGSVIGIFG